MDPRNHRRMMSLGAVVHKTGRHVAGRRNPDADTGGGTNCGQIVDAARMAERDLFDVFFLPGSAAVSRIGKVVKFEPITVVSALAAMADFVA